MPEKIVFGGQIQPRDLVTDPSGDYVQYGRITSITRKGGSCIATTESGTDLSFGLIDRVQVERD